MASRAGGIDARVLDDAGLEGLARRVSARLGTVSYPVRVLAAATGYAITAFVAWYLLVLYPGWAGQDVDVWLRVGAEVRDGISPYAPGPWASVFFYAPPWAVLFGAVSWLGKPMLWFLITLAELGALRYIAGSWLRVGYFGLCFLTGAELVSGAFNLVVAAALAAAIRGHSGPAALVALAKLSPGLAIRNWRTAAVVMAVATLVTLPVLGWWVDWAAFLIGGWSGHPGDGFHGSFVARLAVAALLLGTWRSPKAGAAAAAIAIPIMYPISAVLFYALVTPPRSGTTKAPIPAPATVPGEQSRA